MTFSLAEAQRMTLEMYRETTGEPLAAQSVVDVVRAQRVGEFDKILSEAYEFATTMYYAGRLKERYDNLTTPLSDADLKRGEIGRPFPEVAEELEKLVASGRIPSIAFGFMDIVQRGLRELPLTEEYQGNSGVQGLYARAQQIAVQMIENEITLPEHRPIPPTFLIRDVIQM